jgi:cyclic nucleotide-binding protein
MNKLAKPSKPVNLQRANPPEASVQSNKAALAWVECFPGLSQLEAATKSRLLAGSQLLERAVGANVFAPGEASNELFFLLEGTLRVQQTSRSGQEIVLYRVHAGESCVLSNACLFAYQSQTAAGIAETPVRVASIPKQLLISC